MASGLHSRRWYGRAIILTVALLATQLTGCNREPEQRRQFIDFLQNSVAANAPLPALDEAQKQRFGPYAEDYQQLYHFSQQLQRVRSDVLLPTLTAINALRTPRDYLQQRDAFRQQLTALNNVLPQVRQATAALDAARRTQKYPEDLQSLYQNRYQSIVVQPTAALAKLVPALQQCVATLIEVGDFLKQHEENVTFNQKAVQLNTLPLVNQYNALMTQLTQQYQTLLDVRSATRQALALP